MSIQTQSSSNLALHFHPKPAEPSFRLAQDAARLSTVEMWDGLVLERLRMTSVRQSAKDVNENGHGEVPRRTGCQESPCAPSEVPMK